MSCDGLAAIDPMCQLGDGMAAVAQSALSSTADAFGTAAVSATTWLWQQIDAATTVDLTSPTVTGQLAVSTAIAGVLCVALFAVQLITAVLRREPGALGRAVRGLVICGVGSAFALAATRILITVVDALADGLVQHTLGTNITGIGAKLNMANLAAIQSPAVTLLLSLALLASVVLVWAAMMVRKMMLLVMAVLAPIAFAGATADLSRSWVRRWVEFVIAMVVSKLLLVMVLCLGVAITADVGSTPGQPGSTGATQLAVGTLLLLLGGLAPWMAIRMTHFAGDSLHTMHSTAALSTAGANTAIAAPQKALALHAQGQAAVATLGGTTLGGAAAGRASHRPASPPASTVPAAPSAASSSGAPAGAAAPTRGSAPPPSTAPPSTAPPSPAAGSAGGPVFPGARIDPVFAAPKNGEGTAKPPPTQGSAASSASVPMRGPAAAPKPAATSNPAPPRPQPAAPPRPSDPPRSRP